jgi:hypothetical protein
MNEDKLDNRQILLHWELAINFILHILNEAMTINAHWLHDYTLPQNFDSQQLGR